VGRDRARRAPIDPYAAPKPQLQTAMPTTLVQACEALGVALDATPEDIKRIGDALRVANHPDHARDEHAPTHRHPNQTLRRSRSMS